MLICAGWYQAYYSLISERERLFQGHCEIVGLLCLSILGVFHLQNDVYRSSGSEFHMRGEEIVQIVG